MNYRLCPECKREFLQKYRQQVCCSRACKDARRLRIVREFEARRRALEALRFAANLRIVEAAGANGAAPSQPNGANGAAPSQPHETPAARAYADRLIAESATRAVQRWNDRKAARKRIAARLAAITAHPVAETVVVRDDGSRVIRRGNCPVASWA